MARLATTDDAALLRAAAAGDARAFEVFYERHLAAVTGFHLCRTGRRELAFDLTAETFAAVVLACGTSDAERGNAAGWLFGIASNKPHESLRRGRVEADARRRLRHEPIVVDDADLAVLERSVRLVRFPAGERLLVYTTLGRGLFIKADPEGCDRAQHGKLLALHPADDAVRRRALSLLGIDQQRPPGRQTLTISALGRTRSGGTGIPVQPGRPLPTGIAFSGGSAAATQYGGIAVAGARTITLTTKAHAKRAVRRTIGVRERLFAFTLPRGTGPVTLRQRAADGRTLARQRLRG